MARWNPQKERILRAFLEAVKRGERDPLSHDNLISLESCLRQDLSPQAIKRWAAERNLEDSDVRFLLTSFLYCFRHFMSDEIVDDE
jgi:hypothetical protein